MKYAYKIGERVTLLQGNNDTDNQIYWADSMNQLVGSTGVIRNRFIDKSTGRPAYDIVFDDDWCCQNCRGFYRAEEYWLNPSIKDVTPDDANAIDSFMEEC